MSNTLKEKQKNSLLALYGELEVRFGPALAQSIVDEIKKVNEGNQDNDHQDYMAVKALSEVVELFRRETRNALKAFKATQDQMNGLPENIPSLAGERARRDLERKLACYYIAQKAFYTLYRRALKEMEYPGKKYQTVHLPEMMSKAA